MSINIADIDYIALSQAMYRQAIERGFRPSHFLFGRDVMENIGMEELGALAEGEGNRIIPEDAWEICKLPVRRMRSNGIALVTE